jgi:ADP-ribose pyrophosphatase YjhB (NUDIX family)
MQSQSIECYYQYCPQCGARRAEGVTIPFRCHGCGFAQFFGPVAAVGALITNDTNELLLVRRARNPGKGLWGLPGGFVDRGESVEDAMRREVKEETELEVCDTRYLMSHPNDYNYRGIISPVIDLFYTARAVSPESISLAKDELEGHLWTRPSAEHLSDMAFHSNRLAVECWLQQNS